MSSSSTAVPPAVAALPADLDAGLRRLRACLLWPRSFVRHNALPWSMRCLPGWYRMRCGRSSNRCCPDSGRGPKAAAGRRSMIGRCSPRSSTCSPAAVPGGTCHRRSGSAFRPHTAASPPGFGPGCSTSCTAGSSIGSVPVGTWTGPPRSWTQRTCGRKGGLSDRSQPGRSRQERLEDPHPLRCRRHSPRHGGDLGEHPRQCHAATHGRCDSGGALTSRSAAPPTRSVAGGQGLRLSRTPPVAAGPGHRSADRPPRRRQQRTPRPLPVEDRTHPGLAERLSPADDALRTSR